MKLLRTKILISLLYFTGLLASPVFGIESHHCSPHIDQAGHTPDCFDCSWNCLPESPFEHFFENAILEPILIGIHLESPTISVISIQSDNPTVSFPAPIYVASHAPRFRPGNAFQSRAPPVL